MAIGAYPAQADELSDLRANQQLLQQRLDQLAQIPAPGAPYPRRPAGTDRRRRHRRRQLPALLPGARHRHLDPGRRRNPRVARLLLQRRQPEPGLPVEHHARRQRPGAGDPAQHPCAGAAGHRGGGGAGARQLDLRAEPARIEALFRDPHPDRLGRGAHLHGIRLGRLEPRSRRAAATRPRCRTTCTPRLRFAYATLGGFWPARRTRTSPIPTPAPRRSISAAPSATRASCACRRCATRCRWRRMGPPRRVLGVGRSAGDRRLAARHAASSARTRRRRPGRLGRRTPASTR